MWLLVGTEPRASPRAKGTLPDEPSLRLLIFLGQDLTELGVHQFSWPVSSRDLYLILPPGIQGFKLSFSCFCGRHLTYLTISWSFTPFTLNVSLIQSPSWSSKTKFKQMKTQKMFKKSIIQYFHPQQLHLHSAPPSFPPPHPARINSGGEVIS